MRYWVYINDKVDGPYDETKLVTLNGFSQNTLICSEEVASNGGQEWVKASSVFEFDEVPVQESSPTQPQSTPSNSQAMASNTAGTDLLLSKLESLTTELSHLHQKLDSMQTHLDKALAQNEQLARQVALQSPMANQEPTIAPLHTDAFLNTITLAPIDAKEKTRTTTTTIKESDLGHTTPKGEELVISSALDSIYGAKPIPQPVIEETFQDLLSKPEENESESTSAQPETEPTIKEALVTTPSADEMSRDELINELTASPREDLLDQIIQEHQTPKEEAGKPTAQVQSPSTSSHDGPSLASVATAAAGAAAMAGLANISHSKKTRNPAEEQPSSSDGKQPLSKSEPFLMATDKNNPSDKEVVLPVEEMPADVNSVQTPQAQLNDLSSLEETPLEDDPSETPITSKPFENTVQELVPGAELEKTVERKDGFYEIAEEQQPNTQGQGSITNKDLEDAFGPQNEDVSTTPAEVQETKNPNDLTEIELKAGSTYLISDFVPPAQNADDASAAASTLSGAKMQQETMIQDMLAVTNTREKTQVLSTEGLPKDVTVTAANRVSLENTIQAKRGASLDIKTVPMVPEPANAKRLNVNDLDDMNSQHDIKTSKAGGKSITKIILGLLVSVLLLLVIYVALCFMHKLPDSLNLLSKNTEAPLATSEELLQENPLATATEQPVGQPEQMEQVLSTVQNFMLPNGRTLQQFIQEKHSAISNELISWEIVDAVEPDNYSITVKIPPENPQNIKTVYRFNYNTQDGTLDPTISDAKNLLDQASM